MDLRPTVEQARLGDLSAFSRLFELIRPRALMLARRILGDEQAAEDAVQDAFLAAFRRAGDLDDATGFENWLLEFVRLCSLHALASRNRRRSVEVGERVDEYDFERDLLDRVIAAGVFAQAGHLRDDLRQIFWMYYGEDVSLAQISSQLNLTVDAARKRLHGARLYLRQRCAGPISERELPVSAPSGAGLPGGQHAHVAVTTYTLGLDAISLPAARVQTTTYLYDALSPQEVDLRGNKFGPPSVTLSHATDSRITTMIA